MSTNNSTLIRLKKELIEELRTYKNPSETDSEALKRLIEENKKLKEENKDLKQILTNIEELKEYLTNKNP